MLFPLRDHNPADETPWVTYAFVAINAVVMIWVYTLSDQRHAEVVYRYGFVPARLGQLNSEKPIIVQPPVLPHERPLPPLKLNPVPTEIIFSMFSCMFLHAGLAHILGNMWFLWVFGDNVEHRLGHINFALFYLLAGVGASLCHWALHPASKLPVVGASGAVAAVLGAYAVAFPWARVKSLLFLVIFVTIIELPALVVLGLWFGGQLLSAYGELGVDLDGGVAWWAHIGGFAAGAIVMALYDLIARPDKPDPWRRYLEETYGHEQA